MIKWLGIKVASAVEETSVFLKALSYWAFISVLDLQPEFMKRYFLSKEYSGEALERRVAMRIGHPRMFSALWRMTSINTRPAVGVGDPVAQGVALEPLENESRTIDLLALSQSLKKPLVINFGSCT